MIIDAYSFHEFAFGDATDADTFMDTAVAQLKDTAYTGMVKVGFSPDNVARYLAGPIGILFTDTPTAVAAAEHNLEADLDYIKQLDTTLRDQVHAGQKPTGTPYSIDDWTKFAGTVGSDIATQTQAAWDGSFIANIPSSARDAAYSTVQTVEDDAKKVAPYVAAAATAGIGGYVLFLTAPMWVPQLLKLFKGKKS